MRAPFLSLSNKDASCVDTVSFGDLDINILLVNLDRLSSVLEQAGYAPCKRKNASETTAILQRLIHNSARIDCDSKYTFVGCHVFDEEAQEIELTRRETRANGRIRNGSNDCESADERALAEHCQLMKDGNDLIRAAVLQVRYDEEAVITRIAMDV